MTSSKTARFSKVVRSNYFKWANTLKVRLIASSLLMTLLVLPIIGFTLTTAFESKLTSSIKNELSAFSYSILSVAEVENNALLMPELLLENQFNISQSGLYAFISLFDSSFNSALKLSSDSSVKPSNKTLWRSPSLLGLSNLLINKAPDIGQSTFSTVEFEQQKHFVFSLSVSFSDNNQEFPVTVNIVKNLQNYNESVAQFKQQLWLWLLILMALLFAVQSLWLMWTLKPLATLKSELAQIEQGKLANLEQSYPEELNKVTSQLNILLDTEKKQRQRYRNALSDLAHSLKTPLAVIQTQTDLSNASLEQLNVINRMIEHQLKRAQSAGESSWYLGINIEAALNKLVNSLIKIYRDKALSIQLHGNLDQTFQGDETDFLEIFGNLLDNACKAATHSVSLNVELNNKALTFKVADDGQGLSEDIQQQVLERGTRADTYQQGHGIGLAIVKDLVASYQGNLSIQSSKALGGAEFIVTFPKQTS